MDWARAIKRNREALMGIVATLFAMLGLDGSGGSVGRIPRWLRRDVLRALRPAEYAVRRLIVMAARGLVAKLPPSRPMPKDRIIGKGRRKRSSFQLFDPRKRFNIVLNPDRHLYSFSDDPRAAAHPATPPVAANRASRPKADLDAEVDAEPLCRRLRALMLALKDVPRQAKRLARWRARREAMAAAKFTSPIRPGPPPGTRGRSVLDAGSILTECHELAFDVLTLKPNTS